MATATGGGWLDRLERAGNRLPEPMTLFAIGLGVILVVSHLAELAGAALPHPRDEDTIRARSLLDSDGIWWLSSHLVENFVEFRPLGLVLVAMLGMGLAERSGLFAAAFRRAMRRLPTRLLTPGVLVLGVLMAADPGYIILPPLAALLFAAAGRPPLAGLAAAAAGVAAGFSANYIVTFLDAMLAGLTETAAQLLAPDYTVFITANWYFMAVSAVILPLVGWWVTHRWVEPRLEGPGEPGSGDEPDHADEGDRPERGLRWARWTLLLTLAAVVAASALPGAPLAGSGEAGPRWMEALVPLMLLVFALPGLAYGLGAGTIRSDADVARMLHETMAIMAPYIVLAFFAAQMIAAFDHSRLGTLLAITGGDLLAGLGLPAALLMVGLAAVAALLNLFIGSASAKYALLAPIFVPMFMQAGISPELTQAAYRVGDSVTNAISPLNPYLVVILTYLRRYRPDAGLGTLVALQLPYSLAFAAVWLALLVAWIALGWPLGPGAGLTYEGAGA
ncbi:MAG: AbgT family transporter [Thiohalospira sp.]